MCNFRVGKAAVAERFGIDFDATFADSVARLAELVDAGFVTVDDEAVRVTPRGRLFVRNAAMAFDRYLDGTARKNTGFSRTV
jgi:oxygen-independent coproporphyrinogen-3 oxidase